MVVSAMRVAACACVLVGGLILGDNAAGPAVADSGDAGQAHHDSEASKDTHAVNAVQGHEVDKSLGEHADITNDEGDGNSIVAESNVATFSDTTGPAPEVAPGNERVADPDGSESGAGGDGSDGSDDIDNTVVSDNIDNIDNTVVSANTVRSTEPAAQKLNPAIEYPFLFYLLEIRRDGGDWWNANQIISRLGQAISSHLPAPPEPTPAPGPAFRGGEPEPEPEPVLDASGGAGGGSAYQATEFGGAPVLQAPMIVVPAPPAASARFPSTPQAVAPGAGLAAPRSTRAEPESAGPGVRSSGTPEQVPAGTITSMSGQMPRQGYTQYLRSAGLPQLAGAALPGVVGILLLTFGGGVIGYRQASAGRMVRMSGSARYLP